MSENLAELQLSFDFAETEEDKIHGGRQIAAPVDNSLVEDEEDEDSSSDSDDELKAIPVSHEISDELSELDELENIPENIDDLNQLDEEPDQPELPAEAEVGPETIEPAELPEEKSTAEIPAVPVISIQEEPPVKRFAYSEFARKEMEVKETIPVQETPESASAIEKAPAPVTVPSELSLSRKQPLLLQKELQRAALAWLASGFPTAAATRVPTRLAKFRADAAAFWSTPRKNRLLQPERTVLVEARATRGSCWPECSGSEEIVPQLRLEQERRQAFEAEIRIREPHLLDSDVLFPEIEYWNYSGTKNPEYKICLRRIRDYERALYRGSRFERIHRADVANELYLAVPEGLIHPNELAEGWGLLYVCRNLSVKVIKKALPQECPQENMLHLSQNIAASSLNDVLFAHGVYLSSNGKATFRRPPRRRRIEHFF